MWPVGLSARLPVVGSVGRHPAACLMGRGPVPLPRLRAHARAAMRPRGVAGRYPGFPPAIPGRGAGRPRVTHPFAADRPPRGAGPPLDLHVLGAPPAFILRGGSSARLACVRRAASVHPEPGSNSPFERLARPPSRPAARALAIPALLGCLLGIRLSRFVARPLGGGARNQSTPRRAGAQGGGRGAHGTHTMRGRGAGARSGGRAGRTVTGATNKDWGIHACVANLTRAPRPLYIRTDRRTRAHVRRSASGRSDLIDMRGGCHVRGHPFAYKPSASRRCERSGASPPEG